MLNFDYSTYELEQTVLLRKNNNIKEALISSWR